MGDIILLATPTPLWSLLYCTIVPYDTIVLYNIECVYKFLINIISVVVLPIVVEESTGDNSDNKSTVFLVLFIILAVVIIVIITVIVMYVLKRRKDKGIM